MVSRLGCYILPIILILKQIIILLGLNMTVVFTTSLSFGNIQPASAGFFEPQELSALICGNLYKPALGFLCAIFTNNMGNKKADNPLRLPALINFGY
ncbi:MAG: hypothetical protein ACXWT3_08120 [Methylococcaceae bacterium]